MADEKRGLELKLQSALTDYIDIETKYKELTSKHNQLENELKNKDKEIETNKEKAKELEQKLEETSKVLEEHRINLAVEKKSSGDMKSYLAMSQKECVELVKKEAEAKAKVLEPFIYLLISFWHVFLHVNQFFTLRTNLISRSVQSLFQSKYTYFL